MIAKRISVLFLFACLAASVTLLPRHSYSQARATFKADGGLPVPPYPTGSVAALTFEADGGLPVPPYPTGSVAITSQPIA